MAGKYIVGLMVSRHGAVRALAVVFPEFLEHREMAMRVFKGVRCIVSAGMFQVYECTTGVEVEVSGESIGLNLKPRPVPDEFLIKEALGLVYRDRGDAIPQGTRPGEIVQEIQTRIPDFTADELR